MRYFTKVIFLLTFLLSCAHTRSLSIYLQNDFVNNTDRHYTNGIDITWISDTKFNNNAYSNYSVAFIHDTYTPDDLNEEDESKFSFPYAGYMGTLLSRYWWQQKYYHRFSLSLGIVGPSTKAQELQDAYHSISSNTKAKGWDTQHKDKALYGFEYQFVHKTFSKNLNKYSLGWFNSLDAKYGTYQKSYSIASSVRFGSNIPNNFVTPLNPHSLSIYNYKPKGFGYSFGAGVYQDVINEFYILDSNDYQYKRDKNSMQGHFYSIDLYTTKYRFSFILKTARLNLDKNELDEMWAGINFISRF